MLIQSVSPYHPKGATVLGCRELSAHLPPYLKSPVSMSVSLYSVVYSLPTWKQIGNSKVPLSVTFPNSESLREGRTSLPSPRQTGGGWVYTSALRACVLGKEGDNEE